MACLSISLASSAFGTKTSTEELAPNPELIAIDSTANHYRQERTKLEKENKKLSTQTNHEGTIYYKLQSVIDKNTAMIADYNARVLELDMKLEGKNELLSSDYQEKVNLTAWTLVWITIFLELLFELCIAYIWYYYYRSYIEKSGTSSSAIEIPTPTSNTMPNKDDFLSLKNELKSIQQQLQSFQNKTTSIQEPVLNGHPQNNENSISNLSSTKPIGFYTDRQLATMGIQSIEANKSIVQTCTNVYTQDLSDIHTIEHQYMKGGKTITVYYTMAQIEARIAQYDRGVNSAEKQNLGKDVVANRNSWLNYWKEKREELLKKRETKSKKSPI